MFDFHDYLHCTDRNEDGFWQDMENPDDYMEEDHDPKTVCRSNYSTVAELAEKVQKVLQDQVQRGQVVKLSEEDAKRQYPPWCEQNGEEPS